MATKDNQDKIARLEAKITELKDQIKKLPEKNVRKANSNKIEDILQKPIAVNFFIRDDSSPKDELWNYIKTETENRSFDKFEEVTDRHQCLTNSPCGLDNSYKELIKIATDFLGLASPDEDVKGEIEENYVSAGKDQCPIELIWSYWLEEGLLVQAINAVSRRFQNKPGLKRHDPLSHLEIAPLRLNDSLNNIIYDYIESEGKRLSMTRRSYEYDHHYGLRLLGTAVNTKDSVDSRTKFLESFHTLLRQAMLYFRDKDDAQINEDSFPLLNCLRELHEIIAYGAHNQYGSMPARARREMLVQQWILAQDEMQQFLGGRAMVPQRQKWMSRVDTMKNLQGWDTTPVHHYYDLATCGEQLLLSVRLAAWTQATTVNAAGWAGAFREQIQTYIHAYRVVTGVDIANDEVLDFTMPGKLLRERENKRLAVA